MCFIRKKFLNADKQYNKKINNKILIPRESFLGVFYICSFLHKLNFIVRNTCLKAGETE